MKIIKTSAYIKMAQRSNFWEDEQEQVDDSWIDWSKPCFQKTFGYDPNDPRTYLVYPSEAEIQQKAQQYFGKQKIEVTDTEASKQSFDLKANIRQDGSDIGYLEFTLDTDSCEWFVNGFENNEWGDEF